MSLVDGPAAEREFGTDDHGAVDVALAHETIEQVGNLRHTERFEVLTESKPSRFQPAQEPERAWEAATAEVEPETDDIGALHIKEGLDEMSGNTPKSKATTTNPKDLFGIVKVDMTKVPPISIAWEAMAMGDGADKYGPYNWRDKPVVASIYVAASLRHILDWWEGQEIAPDSEVHHLGHGKACCGILLDAQHRGVLIDDRPAHDDMLAQALDEMSATLKRHAKWKREGADAWNVGAGADSNPYDPVREVAAHGYWRRGYDQRAAGQR